MKPLLSLCLVAALISSCSEKMPARVRVENGNVFIVYVDNTQKQLTDDGANSEAALSPSNEQVAYIKNIQTSKPADDSFCVERNLILMYTVKTGKTDTIIKPLYSEEPEKLLMNLNNLVFSPDGQFLYFSSCAWVTSSAIHRYDITTGKESFFTSGNSLKVIESGKYKGYLIVSKHKYYEGEAGGSYEHYWLVDKDGKEIKDIGEKEDGALPE